MVTPTRSHLRTETVISGRCYIRRVAILIVRFCTVFVAKNIIANRVMTLQLTNDNHVALQPLLRSVVYEFKCFDVKMGTNNKFSDKHVFSNSSDSN